MIKKSKRCDANVRKGAGTGVCNWPLDEHGNCDWVFGHLSDAPEIPPGVREADVWDLESGTRDEPESLDATKDGITSDELITLLRKLRVNDVYVRIVDCDPEALSRLRVHSARYDSLSDTIVILAHQNYR